MKKTTINLMLTSLFFLGSSAFAQKGGMVINECKTEIEKFCADKPHEQGQVHTCLEANRKELSGDCQKALDSSGPGKGMGRGKKK